MAHLMTLTENWTLAGGVFDPFPIEKPMDVRSALIAQGLIKPRARGLEALGDEWIWLCEWTYETVFTCSGDDDRAQLELEYAGGAYVVTLNGSSIQGDDRGALDISNALIEGENRLSITFVPHHPLRRSLYLGLNGAVRVRMGYGLSLQSHSIEAGDAALTAKTWLNVFTSGRYAFHYVVALGDDAVLNTSFDETLRPGPAHITHALPIEKPVLFDPKRPDDTTYTVRLSVERLGLGCLLAFERAYFPDPDDPPLKVCRVPDWITREEIEARLPLLKPLGVDALELPGRASIAPALGFKVAAPQTDAHQIGAFALLESGNMHELSGGEKYWPPGGPVWRLTDSRWPDPLDLDRLCGVNAMGDAGRAARLTRFLQAESVRRTAYRARMAGKPAVIDWPFELTPHYGGTALVELSGAARPAYDALEAAWAPLAVCALLPESMSARPGEQIKLGAWLLGARNARGVAAVDIACYMPDGSLLGAISLPCPLTGGYVGELAVTLPKAECALVVRIVAAVDGEAAVQSDWTLCVTEQEEPLSPLVALAPARLTQKDGYLINEGALAALGVCSLGYRALLPGEKMSCADTYECLNGLV